MTQTVNGTDLPVSNFISVVRGEKDVYRRACEPSGFIANYSKRMKTEEDIVKYGSNKKLYHKILASEKMFASSGYSFLKLHILSAVLSRFCPVRIIFAVEYN